MAVVDGVDGWLTPCEGMALFRRAEACRGRGAIVEIGSWHGRSTIVLATASKASSRTIVHAVDPHRGLPGHGDGSSLSMFRDNLAAAGVADLVAPRVCTSAEAARTFEQPVELLYIDGAHDHQSVLEDFLAWCPLVADGGVMAFHDTIGYPGPRRVVRDHLVRSRQFRRIRFAGSLAWGEKVARNTVRERVANHLCWWAHELVAGAYAIARLPWCRACLGAFRAWKAGHPAAVGR